MKCAIIADEGVVEIKADGKGHGVTLSIFRYFTKGIFWDFAVVINAAPRGRLAEEARDSLTEKGVKVIEAVLHQRVAFSHAVIDGRSVHEYEPEGAAAQEIDALYRDITGLYGDKKRKGAAA